MPGRARRVSPVAPVPSVVPAPPASHVEPSTEEDASTVDGQPYVFDGEKVVPAGESSGGYPLTPAPDEEPEKSSLTSRAEDAARDGDLGTAVSLLVSAVEGLTDAVRVIGSQQQWVTDQVQSIGPLVKQLDQVFATSGGNPFAMIKGLMSLRGSTVIEGKVSNG